MFDNGLIMQVTPFSVCDHVSIDWMKMFTIWEGLSLNLQKVGKLVGVEEGFFIKAMRSAINLNSDKYVSINFINHTCVFYNLDSNVKKLPPFR